jgi:hypothetical protein
MMRLLLDHVGKTTFAGYEEVDAATAALWEVDDSVLEHNDREAAFLEIVDMKEEAGCHPSMNLYDVSEIFTKELERESQSIRRLSSRHLTANRRRLTKTKTRTIWSRMSSPTYEGEGKIVPTTDSDLPMLSTQREDPPLHMVHSYDPLMSTSGPIGTLDSEESLF